MYGLTSFSQQRQALPLTLPEQALRAQSVGDQESVTQGVPGMNTFFVSGPSEGVRPAENNQARAWRGHGRENWRCSWVSRRLGTEQEL